MAKRKYQQEYDIAPAITFDGDHVALDIPDDGITDNGWEIVPAHKAQVSPYCIRAGRSKIVVPALHSVCINTL